MVFTGTKVLTLSNDSSPSSFKFQVSRFSKFLWLRAGGGDELVNRSYRDRAADDLGHRDVTRNLFKWIQRAKLFRGFKR